MRSTRRWSAPGIHLGRTLAFQRKGPGDPTQRIESGNLWRASRTPEGPATVHLARDGDHVQAHAWGPGASWVLEHAPALIGTHDQREGFDPTDRIMRTLDKRVKGFRVGRSHEVMRSLIGGILGQKVQSKSAQQSWARLCFTQSEQAPGPHDKLWLPPDPELLGRLPAFAFHAVDVEENRSRTIRLACQRHRRLEECVDLSLEDARRRLQVLPGIGPWTAAQTAFPALGDPDAVPFGDYNLPHLISFVFAGEPRGDDTRMAELLAPYAGHRGRVVFMAKLSGIKPPRYGPKTAIRSLQ